VIGSGEPIVHAIANDGKKGLLDIMFIIAIFLLGWIVQLLWNALIPELFHGPWLSYWQSVGLLLLSRILVGFRGSRHGWRRWKKCGPPWKWRKHSWNMGSGSDYCGPWQNGWQHWQKLTPEERQQAKAEWRQKKEEWKSSWKPGE
jgi:hypothetical protein